MAGKPLMRGRVVRLDAASRPYVEVTELGLGRAIGPCPYLTSVGVLAVDDYVLVAVTGGVEDDVTVIGKYA